MNLRVSTEKKGPKLRRIKEKINYQRAREDFPRMNLRMEMMFGMKFSGKPSAWSECTRGAG